MAQRKEEERAAQPSKLSLFLSLLVSDRNRNSHFEFSLLAETEYSAAKNHRIFGFGQIFGTFTYFRPKVNNLLRTRSRICKNSEKKLTMVFVFPDLSIMQ
jgi:hypothetical protein